MHFVMPHQHPETISPAALWGVGRSLSTLGGLEAEGTDRYPLVGGLGAGFLQLELRDLLAPRGLAPDQSVYTKCL